MFKYLFFSFLLIAFVGCNNNVKSKKKVLRTCIQSEVFSFDVRKASDALSSSVAFMLFQGLTELRQNGEVTLALAKSYHLSEDKKTYTFYLKDCFWSDGKKITAYDFEKTWRDVIDPKNFCPSSHLFYCIKNVEKIVKNELGIEKVGFFAQDEKTFVVELERPNNYFLSLISFCSFFAYPSHIKENSIGHFVSSGPFILNEVVYNYKVQLIKNEKFWDAKRVKIDQIDLFVVDNENSALKMFEKDQIDWLGSPLSSIAFEALTAKEEEKIQRISIASNRFIALNMEDNIFKNMHMRKAFSLAVDKEAIVQYVTGQKERIARRWIPPVLMEGKNNNLINGYAPALAKEYLERGLKELKIEKEELQITFIFRSHLMQKRIAEALQEQWNHVLGIKVFLQQIEPKVLIDKLQNHQFQIGLAYLCAQNTDPLSLLERFKYKNFAKNYSQFEEAKFIELLDLANDCNNYKKRLEYIERAENILLEKTAVIPLYHCNYIALVKPYLQNGFIGALGDLHFDEVEINDHKK